MHDSRTPSSYRPPLLQRIVTRRILARNPSTDDHPLPLWLIFPLLFAGVYLAHSTLLRLPYYWDEAGYYIPAAYDFFRTGSLIPTTTLSNAHPPLPSIYLALWWKLAGFSPFVTRTAMCFIAAIALLGVYRIAMVVTCRIRVAVATTLLTALYPIWFAQSSLAHADLFAAAATLWGLAFALGPGPAQSSHSGDRYTPQTWAAVACFSIAVLAKETAIVTPLALAVWNFWQSWRVQLETQPDTTAPRRHLATAAEYLLPTIPLAIWYAWHYHCTGFIFGNPEFLRYNATATLSPLRILLALGHRILHLTAHMNMFVPVLCTLAAMMLPPLEEQDGSPRPRINIPDQQQIYIVLAANLVFFSVVGGALLTRYLLPLYPLVLLLCVNTLRRRVRYWPALIALTAAAFIAGLFVNPPYRFAPEDNLAYTDVITLHQQAIGDLLQRYPQAIVLTAWPATDELTKPELGYVNQPLQVVAIDNFSLAEIQKAAQSKDPYTAAFVFSTKYDPKNVPLRLGLGNESVDTRYFDFHRDLPPEAIAHLLGGAIAWRAERKGQRAAILHFNRPQFASTQLPPVTESASASP